MSIFQKISDKINTWSLPQWLKVMISEIWLIIKAILISAGKEYVKQLESKIIEVSHDSTLTNDQKFNKVFKYARTIGITLTDSSLNLLIESIVNYLKSKLII